jgi:hypothetical protein
VAVGIAFIGFSSLQRRPAIGADIRDWRSSMFA